jgi:hypothetical protein
VIERYYIENWSQFVWKNLSELSDKNLYLGLEGMEKLLNIYYNNSVSDDCPLCMEVYCTNCPWVIFTNKRRFDSNSYSYPTKTIGGLRLKGIEAVRKYPKEFPSLRNDRIEELEMWIHYYIAELYRRKTI